MNLAMSDIQKRIVDSVKKYLIKESPGLARDLEKKSLSLPEKLWKDMSNLGWLGTCIPEQYEGMGLNILDYVLILEQLGRYLVPGPFIPTVLSALAILKYGNQEQRSQLLPRIVSGEAIVTPALLKPEKMDPAGMRNNPSSQAETEYKPYLERIFVPYLDVADHLIIFGDAGRGNTAFLSKTGSENITWQLQHSLAANRLFSLKMNSEGVRSEDLLGNAANGAAIEADLNNWGALFHAAFILGLLDRILEMAVEHAKLRVQFGKPIGSLQIIQHQCADMCCDIDKLRLLVYEAAWLHGTGNPAVVQISMAKARASEAARRVSLLGVKILGGVGISEEYDMQLYYRWAKASENAFGTANHHREVIAECLN